MKLSTKILYGIRLMLTLAQNYGNGPVFLKDVARRQDISPKYLSQIVIPLRSAGLVSSIRGPHGGYVLSRNPSLITLKEITDTLEGEVCLVECIKNPSFCNRVATCASYEIWVMLENQISDTLNSVTLGVCRTFVI